MSREPGIIIAGVQKCGTSALYDCLCQHTGMAGPKYVLPESSPYAPKELHFFSDLKRFQLGWQWYCQHYEDDHLLKIDATPEYVIHRRAIKAMAEKLPHARVILVLRNPFDRALSAWNHWQATPADEKWPVLKPSGTLLDNIEAEMRLLVAGRVNGKSFFGRGLYRRSIELLRKHYPDNQIKIVFLDDLMARPEEALEGLQTWLGLPVEPLEFRHIHARKRQQHLPSLEVLKDLWDTYRVADEGLKRILQREVPWPVNWETWKENNPQYTFEESGDHEEFHKTCEMTRRWLASDPRTLKKKRGTRGLAIVNGLSAEHLIENLRNLMCQGERPNRIEVQKIWDISGDQRRLLLSVLVEFGEEDLAAELYRQELQHG